MFIHVSCSLLLAAVGRQPTEGEVVERHSLLLAGNRRGEAGHRRKRGQRLRRHRRLKQRHLLLLLLLLMLMLLLLGRRRRRGSLILLLLLLLGKVRREFGNFFVGISAAQTFDLKSLCGLHQGSQVGLGNTNLTPERKILEFKPLKK